MKEINQLRACFNTPNVSGWIDSIVFSHHWYKPSHFKILPIDNKDNENEYEYEDDKLEAFRESNTRQRVTFASSLKIVVSDWMIFKYIYYL